MKGDRNLLTDERRAGKQIGEATGGLQRGFAEEWLSGDKVNESKQKKMEGTSGEPARSVPVD